jgi:adenylosuccinate lyase
MSELMHPIENRYEVNELRKFLSEDAYIQYQLDVERAHVKTLYDLGVLPKGTGERIVAEMMQYANITHVTADEVKRKEAELKHDIRALVEVLKSKLSDDAKPYVHLGLTSYDVVDNARALMVRDATKCVILPDMIKFGLEMIGLADHERSTRQIGRTHGQHAEPTTFGKEIAVYVDRWGKDVERVYQATKAIRGKIGGAVGTRAAIDLLGIDPYAHETLLLKELDLEPEMVSTQISQPETFANYFMQMMLSFATLNDFANDMRQLQRTEIGEVSEGFGDKQVGSSTMPHKRNPISWENICSQYRMAEPKIIAALANVQSEHQRDLLNSATERYLLPEILVPFTYSVKRATGLVKKLQVDKDAMQQNMYLTQGEPLAEPAYILLARTGHPDAHEYVRKLSMKAKSEGKPFYKILKNDPEIGAALKRLDPATATKFDNIFTHLEDYAGKATEDVNRVISYWSERLPDFVV